MEAENEIREIEGTDENGSSPNNPKPTQKTVRTKVPEAEIHLYRQGKGPINVFKSSLGGWDQNQLEVREILEKYGFKSIFAFNPASGRGAPIRFGRNGRSVIGYRDGSVIHVDGEPKVIIEPDLDKFDLILIFPVLLCYSIYRLLISFQCFVACIQFYCTYRSMIIFHIK
ncbi:hypothetical protein OIU78_012492 [Salix suchowensis]|nr:hypothetical protein OIU78_012492 [Salix suchowensis]